MARTFTRACYVLVTEAVTIQIGYHFLVAAACHVPPHKPAPELQHMLPGGLHTALQARVCPWQVALPLQAEAMSVSSRLLAASAVLTALLALFWPQLESLVTTYLSHNGTDSKCPLVRRQLQLCVPPAHAQPLMPGCLFTPGIHRPQPS